MKILLLDIETAPHQALVWGLWNQNIGTNQIVNTGYTMCWAAKWLGDKQIKFSSIYHDEHKTMIESMYSLIDQADMIVHYNGTKFDIPTLNREFLLQRLQPPYAHIDIDLLKTCRRRFKFASNKLDFVCQELGLGGKIQHKGMDLWTGCMEFNPSSWSTMKRYNIHDVRLLEKLYKHLLPWIHNHPNVSLDVDSEQPRCRNCGSSNMHKDGWQYNATLKYQRYRCSDCGKPGRAVKSEPRNILGITS